MRQYTKDEYLSVLRQVTALANLDGLYDLALDIRPNTVPPSNSRMGDTLGKLVLINNVKHVVIQDTARQTITDENFLQFYHPVQSKDVEYHVKGEYIYTDFQRISKLNEKLYRAKSDILSSIEDPSADDRWELVPQEPV